MTKDDSKEKQEDTTDSPAKVLTPWQKANISYLKEHGSDQEDPVVIVSESTEGEVAASSDQPSPETKEEPEDDETGDLESTLKTAKDLPKSKSFADKLPKMKVARQKRLRRRLTLLVSLFGVAAIGMIYYVSPLSKLSQIEISGNQVVTKKEIAEATNLSSDTSIWSAYLNKKIVPNIKKANPRIKTVSVKISHINNLKYTVTEFSEIAYAKDNDVFHPVLENGTILKEAAKVENDSFPILIDFKEGASLDALMSHFKDIDDEVKTNIKEIRSTPTESNEFLMRLVMKDKNEIVASTKDFQDKINFYPQILAEMDGNGVVDMEAGVYWKSFEAIEQEKTEAKAEKDYDDWVKKLEEENTEKIN